MKTAKKIDIRKLRATKTKADARTMVKGAPYDELLRVCQALGIDTAKFEADRLGTGKGRGLNKGTASMGMQNLILGHLHGKKRPQPHM